jgi:excisionase family DNA binding protein
MNAHRWMTTDEAAAYLSMKPGSLRKLARTGQVPAHRIGDTGTYRFHTEELDAVLGLDVDAARSTRFTRGPAGSSGFTNDAALAVAAS